MTGPVVEPFINKIEVWKGRQAGLYWHAVARPRWQTRFTGAQKFVDSEVIRLSEPFTPLRTGKLIQSATLSTDIGSGLVVWGILYARWNYYRTKKPGTQTGPLRGPFWFERMKAVYLKQILNGARKLMGGPSI